MTLSAVPVLKHRIESIDILRGLIMLIMAIDHTRDFFHLGLPDPTNLSTTTPILFFTRFITHFCAPIFVFLSGISAYLAGTRRSKSELSSFLFKRGLWLIFVELFIRTFAVTLNPTFHVYVLQVIWAIGFSMIILGLLVRLPVIAIGIIGGLIFFGHNIFDYVQLPKDGVGGVLSTLFFTANNTHLMINSDQYFIDRYAVITWTGVMLLGYVFGVLYQSSYDQQRRKRVLLIAGCSLILFFLVFRFLNIYGDPAPWAVQKTATLSVISFLNVTKYPCSLLYLSMTIGPGLIMLALTEHVKNKFTSLLIIYGNVPFFYYILHFFLIRGISVILFFASGFHTDQINVGTRPFYLFLPVGFGYSLPVVYLIWFLVVTILYFPCRWFSNYKKTHHDWWLSYL
jgi:uncharacterized membrane protein